MHHVFKTWHTCCKNFWHKVTKMVSTWTTAPAAMTKFLRENVKMHQGHQDTHLKKVKKQKSFQ
jgi:hypothetical protein